MTDVIKGKLLKLEARKDKVQITRKPFSTRNRYVIEEEVNQRIEKTTIEWIRTPEP